MRYVSEDQATQMMGIGYLGEVRQGPDGNLYQYVQGVDGLGNPIGGFWSRLKRGLRKVHGFAQRGASFIPGPYGAAIRSGLKIATPFLQKAGIAGYEGIGALYEAPDGSLYQVQGLAADQELRGIGEDAMTQMMGVGYLGEVRQGPDGILYQQVQGLDEDEELRGLDDDEELRGLDEDEELRGLDEDEELRGFAEDEDLRGLDEDEELRGLDEEDELRGLDEDEDLRGFSEDEELRGVGEDQDMQGIDGYVRQGGMSGLDAYVPQEPPQTRWHVAPAQAAEVWKSPW